MARRITRLLVTALRAVEQESKSTKQRPKSREGKKTIVGHFQPEVAWQLRKLAVDRQVMVQKLLEEAFGDLFEKHHPAARLGRRHFPLDEARARRCGNIRLRAGLEVYLRFRAGPAG